MVADVFNSLHNENKSRNAIVKTKAALTKYGLWNVGKMKLDNIEQIIKEKGKAEIQKIGVREFCRDLSARYGVSDSGVRAKYVLMAKYGII